MDLGDSGSFGLAGVSSWEQVLMSSSVGTLVSLADGVLVGCLDWLLHCWVLGSW